MRPHDQSVGPSIHLSTRLSIPFCESRLHTHTHTHWPIYRYILANNTRCVSSSVMSVCTTPQHRNHHRCHTATASSSSSNQPEVALCDCNAIRRPASPTEQYLTRRANTGATHSQHQVCVCACALCVQVAVHSSSLHIDISLISSALYALRLSSTNS